MPNHLLFAFILICFSKSTHVGCLRNSCLKTSLIILTKVLETFMWCVFSNPTIFITCINNLTICKHARNICAFFNLAQAKNTACIYLLNKIRIMCTYALYDLKEQWAMHLIFIEKRPMLIRETRFLLMTSHDDRGWVGFALDSLFTNKGPPFHYD